MYFSDALLNEVISEKKTEGEREIKREIKRGRERERDLVILRAPIKRNQLSERKSNRQ
jgi:hypothetical protein